MYYLRFSLYSNDTEIRLQILNNSEIPVQVSWQVYNENEKNREFGVTFDTNWSIKIDHYYGTQFPRYFTVNINENKTYYHDSMIIDDGKLN